jgi:O-antigen ligase
VAGILFAYLVSSGLWYVALGILVAAFAAITIIRYPAAAVILWLLLAPWVVETESDIVRKAFWLVHRALPLGTLAIIFLNSLVGIRTRKFPASTLGWPELMMFGYIVVSLLSIAYVSPDPLATSYLLYDRVIVPICLYTIVRLLEPDETDLKRLLPAVVFVLLSQVLIGTLSWTAPGILPAAWLELAGARTTGSLGHPNVLATTVLFCGLIILHMGLSGRGVVRFWAIPLFGLALLTAFLTFSRASWLAGVIATSGALYIYRKSITQLAVVLAAGAALVLGSGMLASQIDFASERLRSERATESALSRLPVTYASLRMFHQKPLAGWGYENFDRFDRQFQSRVGNLVSPDKDHGSHNLYLTILAEQGIIGLTLFLGPTIYWFIRTWSSRRRMPASGFLSRKLVGVLWLIIASYIVVNSFSRMIVVFGLGLWWLTLGLAASLTARHHHGGGVQA